VTAYGRKVGFYGLDLYSLNCSIQAVRAYLDKVDPEAARGRATSMRDSQSSSTRSSTSIRHEQSNHWSGQRNGSALSSTTPHSWLVRDARGCCDCGLSIR
jgi:erythromycin esterase-like protein